MTTKLTIAGMTCNHCVEHVTTALRGLPGVTAVTVSLGEGAATITHDPVAAPRSALIHAVESSGYDASPISEP